MNKNVCIAKGCPFYYCNSSTKYKNGTMDIGKRYMCKKFLRDIKDIVNCKQILVSCLCSVARDEQPNIFAVLFWIMLFVDSGCIGRLVNFDEIKNWMAMQIAALLNRDDTVLIDP